MHWIFHHSAVLAWKGREPKINMVTQSLVLFLVSSALCLTSCSCPHNNKNYLLLWPFFCLLVSVTVTFLSFTYKQLYLKAFGRFYHIIFQMYIKKSRILLWNHKFCTERNDLTRVSGPEPGAEACWIGTAGNPAGINCTCFMVTWQDQSYCTLLQITEALHISEAFICHRSNLFFFPFSVTFLPFPPV